MSRREYEHRFQAMTLKVWLGKVRTTIGYRCKSKLRRPNLVEDSLGQGRAEEDMTNLCVGCVTWHALMTEFFDTVCRGPLDRGKSKS